MVESSFTQVNGAHNQTHTELADEMVVNTVQGNVGLHD